MPKRIKQILRLAILVGIVLRLATAIYLGNDVTPLPGTFDQVSYHNLALRVLGGHGFTFGETWWPATPANAPTAHWSFLYTGYLVLVYALFGPHPVAARLIQTVLAGFLQPYLAFLIGRRLFGDSVGLLAAILTSLYAYFIYYAATLMTEPFYISAILMSLYLTMKLAGVPKKFSGEELPGSGVTLPQKAGAGAYDLRLAAGLGLSLAAAMLLRQLFLIIVPFLFLWILLARKKTLVPVLFSGSLIVLVILPFTLFNYARFGRFVLLNTNAGFAFFWGNHPIYGTHFIPILPSGYLPLIPPELRSLDEAALDQALLRQALGWIVQDPRRYLLLSISRIPPYFMFWPSRDSGLVSNIGRVVSFGILWPFMLFGLLLSVFKEKGAFRLRPPSALLLLYTFIVVYTGIHVLSWTLIRYRLPVDAVLVIFAGYGLVDIFQRVPLLRRWFQSVLVPV